MRRLAPAFVISVVGAGCAAGSVRTEELGRYPKSMNPIDANGRSVYLAANGRCFVELPFEKPPTSGGMPHPTAEVPCPDAMRDPAWQECLGNSILSTESGDDCVCDRSGNPPPPTVPRVSCPRR